MNHSDLLSHLPFLRNYAKKLAARDCEDLLQTTLLHALQGSFDGKNPRAWLATIMRNAHFSAKRKQRVQCFANFSESEEELFLDSLITMPAALPRLELSEVLAGLPTVVLLVALGDELHEAAEVLGIPLGTAKSRVARTRASLRSKL